MNVPSLLQRRWPLFLLVALNLGAALFVGVDLGHRLRVPAMPARPAVAAAPSTGPTPTMIPPPTLRTYPTATPTAAPPTATPVPRPAGLPEILVADDRFTFEPDFYAAEVQSFLEAQGSVLAGARFPVGRGEDSFAHALVGHCIRYSLNPKVLLALIEVQSGLVRGTGDDAALEWALGYRDPRWQGLELQLQWAAYTLADGFREANDKETPLLTDGTLAPIPGAAPAATQSILRLLAYTADAGRFAMLRSDGPGSFVATYQELFGADPRLPLGDSWAPARQPFLQLPFRGWAPISAYFDHEYPNFRPNGTILTYSGQRGYQAYDGHDGWDYILAAGTPVLAAAAGRVVFAGFLDTLCATPAGLVVLDHGNGYRTLYWHLQPVTAQEGTEVAAGQRLGSVGSTGCSTGPHLHLGVAFLGRDTDPYGWCGSEEVPDDPWAAHPAGTASVWLWQDLPSPCPLPASAVVVDNRDPGFTSSPALWFEASAGHAGHALWSPSVADARESTHRAIWRPELPAAGYYFLYTYVPWYDTGRPDTTQARFKVRHASGESIVLVDQAHNTGLWAPLGEFYFSANGKEYVYLDEVTGEENRTVWFDAVVWVRR